jgi:apolipoprotein D and lipocalin family protein
MHFRRYGSLALLIIGGLGVLAACSSMRGGPSGNEDVPQPAKAVDLDHYLGHWYEFARYENGFERGCEAVTADYAKLADGLISVVNSCAHGSVTGPLTSAQGKAKVVANSHDAKLKVSFFGPFHVGDYWVLDHADDYSWSIVGEPSGRYLWILTRAARPGALQRTALIDRARHLGYDVSMLRETSQ